MKRKYRGRNEDINMLQDKYGNYARQSIEGNMVWCDEVS